METSKNIEQNQEQFNDEILREEVHQIEEAEIAKKEKGGYGNPHFTNWDKKVTDDLTGADFNIYRLFKNKSLSLGELKKYQKELEGLELSHERKRFMGYIVDQLSRPENLKWFDPENYEAIWGDEEKE